MTQNRNTPGPEGPRAELSRVVLPAQFASLLQHCLERGLVLVGKSDGNASNEPACVRLVNYSPRKDPVLVADDCGLDFHW